MTNEPNIQATTTISSLKGVKAAYFIGIGGIGMSALARYFHSIGIQVSGYDRSQTDLTRELQKEGMSIHFTDDPNLIPPDIDLVVYTPAIPADQKELLFCKEKGLPLLKRSDVLHAVSADTFNICVAGTHGKTTVTTMIAHILKDTGYGCNAFLGGISVNYHTNFWSHERKLSVIEADEYDRSFLKLNPDIAVITAMDPDHLDIYGTKEAMEDAFLDFAGKIKPGGILIGKLGLQRLREVSTTEKLTYSLNDPHADVYASDITIENGGYNYDIYIKSVKFSGFRLNIGGMHNVENSIAAIAAVHTLGIPLEKIKLAVAAFKGVKRRFEYAVSPKENNHSNQQQPVLVDDYAHHPEELRALLTSVRALFPERSVTVIFQPHLFTRTRDLATGFADALSIADSVILLPVYPARELPIEGVSSSLILQSVTSKDKMLLAKDELLAWIKKYKAEKQNEVIVMAGAGDIDLIVKTVKDILEKDV